VNGTAANLLGRAVPPAFSTATPQLVSVHEGYARWAPTYDSFSNPLLAREERHVLPLLPRLQGKRVLDIACGTGRWLTHFAAAEAKSAVGVDLSMAMLRVASGKKRLVGSLVESNCLCLPFASSIFDFAMCSFSIGHIDNLRNLALEVARVLRPSGDFFVTDLHPEAFARGWRIGFRDETHRPIQVRSRSHSVENILCCFYAAGMKCATHVGLCLGKPEAPIFEAAGRKHLHEPATRVPAVLFCHFKQAPSPTGFRSKL